MVLFDRLVEDGVPRRIAMMVTRSSRRLATHDLAIAAFSDGPIPSVAVFATGGSIPQRRCNAAQGCDEEGLECVVTPTGGSYCAAKTSFETVRGQLRFDETVRLRRSLGPP